MDLLREVICEDKSIVTYKWLSRQLRIPANNAKKLLYQFVTESTEQVHCIYCVAGILMASDVHHIILVVQEDLEVTKKKFSKVTGVHVYSVQASRPQDGEAVLLAAPKPVDDPANPSEFASIVNPNISIVKRSTPIQKPQTKIKPSEPIHSKLDLGSQNTPGGNAKLVPSQPKVAEKPPAKTVNSFFSSGKSKKAQPIKKEEPKMEIEEEPIVERRKRTRKVKSIVQSDDDEEMIDVTEPDDHNLSSSKNEAVEDKPTPEQGMDVDAAVDIEVEAEADVQELPNNNTKRKRGRRRIQKKRTYKNDRGYMVTEDVYEWESCTDEEPEPNKVETSTTLPVKSKVKKENGSEKKAKQGQKSLMSFWGKK
ncbi:hypothetical protein K7432_008016 [Basidiobolus ranarum]|uniref:DNA polymerase delta subunit 3 n=1 Tax=Basidiobolus ranarum TaxID=34480 RepID=A0ABR2WSF1_9FUNG